MSRLILPSRKIWTPPQRQRGYVVLDAYRGGGGEPDYAHTVLQIHPGGSNGDTAITDTSSYARTLTRVGSTIQVVTDTDAPGGTALDYDGTVSCAYTAATSTELDMRAGAFMLDWKLKLDSNLTNGAAYCTILSMTKGDSGVEYEWAVLVQRDYLVFYHGKRGTNQSQIRFYYPGGADLSAAGGVQHDFSLGRDASGNWGAWLDGIRCSDYQFADLAVSLYFGSKTTGTFNLSRDFGAYASSVSGQALYVGNFFASGLEFAGHLNELRYVVGQCRDVSSDYTPRTTPFPDS